MSTREDMRRELKDLARMASKMTGVQTSPSSVRGAPAARAASIRTESRVTVPPMTASIPPSTNARSVSIRTPTAVVLPIAPAPARHGERRGSVLAVMAGLGLAAAMVGGIAVGRSLAEGSTPAAETPSRAAAAGPPAGAVPPRATVIAVMDTALAAPSGPPPVASPAPVVIAASRVASFAAPPRRPVPHYGPKPVLAPSVNADSRPTPTYESLEDLMRRSVAAQSAKR